MEIVLHINKLIGLVIGSGGVANKMIQAVCCYWVVMLKISTGDCVLREASFTFWMRGYFFSLRLLALLFLPPTDCKVSPLLCLMKDPPQALYHFDRPGNLIVGGITSQHFPVSEPLSFDRHAKNHLFSEAM